MSRTSQTLLRLGVPTLAAATMLGGIPALLGTAQAAPVESLTITPVAESSQAAGACQAFVITGSRATGSTVGEVVNVVVTDAAGTATSDVSFCTLPTTTGDEDATQGNEQTVTPAAGTVVSSGSAQTGGGSVDQSRFTLGANTSGVTANAGQGQVVIGLTRNEPTTVGAPVSIRVFQDLNGNNSFDAAANEVQTTTTTTFSNGGPDGSNANQNAVTSLAARQSVEDADPANDAAFAGESRSYRVFATNGPDPIQGATVNYVITTGTTTSAPAALGVTDNDGLVVGNITIPTANSTITFYVNQSDNTLPNADGSVTTTGPDASEPRATINVVVSAAQAAGTVSVTPRPDTEASATNTAATYQTDPAINPRTDGDRTFRVVTDNTSGTADGGRAVTVTVSGGDGDEIVTFGGASGRSIDITTSSDNTDTTGSTTDEFADVVVFDPDEAGNNIPSGQVLTVTATVRGQNSATDSETLTFVATPADARNIDLAPEDTFTLVGTARTFTATVIDGRGNPVAGVPVDFSESGPGAFRNGSSTADDVVTNRAGQASVEVTSIQGEAGTQTITASIDATSFTTQAAGTPAGNTRAGNRVDTATNQIGTASPTPSTSSSPTTPVTTTPPATNTPSTQPPTSGNPTPSGTVCVNPVGISLSRAFITPGVPVTVTVTAPANSVVELQAYSRPSTDYRQVRSAPVGESGTISFDVVPGTNTRLFAACVGQTRSASASQVINVRTALSLTVVRNGTRNYTFQGRILPRRAGQLITLYRVENNGTRVLTSQLRTDATGTYRINRRFTGSGTFGFLTRTGQTLTNAAGESNTPNTVAGVNAGRGQARPTAIF